MIKLIADSTCEISQEEAKELGITIIPMKVMFGEEEYLAGINLDNATFYQKLSKCKHLPKTTQINQDEYIKTIKPMLDNGDEVFVMSISSGLSGTFNSLRLASEELNNSNLVIFDTETFTIAYAALVYEAVKLINSGVTLQELNNKMNLLKSKIKIHAIIDNVKYIVKGGRLSLASGLVAMALKIKPIVTINSKIKMEGKAIGYNNAKKALYKLITNVDETMPVYYGHSNSLEKAEDIKEFIVSTLKLKPTKCLELGPVIGTYAGPNCCGMAYFEK